MSGGIRVGNLIWEKGVVLGGEMMAWEGNKMAVGKDWYREKLTVAVVVAGHDGKVVL